MSTLDAAVAASAVATLIVVRNPVALSAIAWVLAIGYSLASHFA